MYRFFSMMLFSLIMNCTVVAMDDYPNNLLQHYVEVGNIDEIINLLEKHGLPSDLNNFQNAAKEGGYRRLATAFSSENQLKELKNNVQVQNQILEQTRCVSKIKNTLFEAIKEGNRVKIQAGLQRIYNLGFDPAQIKRRGQTPVDLARQLKLDKLIDYILKFASDKEGQEEEQGDIQLELVEKNPELFNAVQLLFESAKTGNLAAIDKALIILTKKNCKLDEICWYDQTIADATSSYSGLNKYIINFLKQKKLIQRKNKLKNKMQKLYENELEIKKQKQQLAEQYELIKNNADNEFEMKFQIFCKMLLENYAHLEENSPLKDFSWYMFVRFIKSKELQKYKDTLLDARKEKLLQWGMDIWEELISKKNLLMNASEIDHYPNELKNRDIPKLTEDNIKTICECIDENNVREIDKKIRIDLPSATNELFECKKNDLAVVNIDDEVGRILSYYATCQNKGILGQALENTKSWLCFDVGNLHRFVNKPVIPSPDNNLIFRGPWVLKKNVDNKSILKEQLFRGAKHGQFEEVKTALDELWSIGIDGTKLIDEKRQTAAEIARKFRHSEVASFIETIYNELVEKEQELKGEEITNIGVQKFTERKIKEINNKLENSNQRQAVLDEIVNKHAPLIWKAWENKKMDEIDHHILSLEVFKSMASLDDFEKFKGTRLYLLKKHAMDLDENFWSWLDIQELFKPASDKVPLEEKVYFLAKIINQPTDDIFHKINVKKVPLAKIAWHETGNVYITMMFQNDLYWQILNGRAISEYQMEAYESFGPEIKIDCPNLIKKNAAESNPKLPQAKPKIEQCVTESGTWAVNTEKGIINAPAEKLILSQNLVSTGSKKPKASPSDRKVRFAEDLPSVKAKKTNSERQQGISWEKFQELLKLEPAFWQENYSGTVLHHILTTQYDQIKKWREEVEWMAIGNKNVLLLNKISIYEANIKRHAGTGHNSGAKTTRYLSLILTGHKFNNLFNYDGINEEVRQSTSTIY